MTFHKKSEAIKGASMHLLDSAILKTKSEGGDPLDAISKAFGEHVAEVMQKLGATNEQLEEMRKKSGLLTEQVSEISQKMARGGSRSGDEAPETIGQRFVNDERVKAFIDSDPSKGAVDFRVKATLTTATTDAAGSAGALATPAFRDSAVPLLRRRPRVRSLLPVIQVSSGSIEWPSQKGRTDGAAMVAEGSTKPSSDIQYELKTTAARVIAHWMKASKQVLEDAPQLRGIIDTELMDGLALKEEDQFLNGDNTGQNLYGLIPQATAFGAPNLPSLADINTMDVIALAMLQLANSYHDADGVILNPGDWLVMRTLKNSQGDYILGSPMQQVNPSLWGVPLVPTPAMAAKKFLVGQFQAAATIYDRWEARIELGYVNDDFVNNLVTILGEERLGLGVKRPDALIYGDFDAALNT